MSLPGDPSADRVLVLTPTGRDGEMVCQRLMAAGYACEVCPDVESLLAGLAGAGVAIVAQEALNQAGGEALLAALDAQEPWSDVPILLLTFALSKRAPLAHAVVDLFERANVMLLQRPLQIPLFLSAVRSAVRARRRQHELRELHRELAGAVQLSDLFISILGHDLRSPLGAISMAAESIVRRSQDERAVRSAGRILTSADRMARMIEQLLDLARARHGGIALDPKATSLAEVARQIVKELEELNPGARFDLVASGDVSGVWDPDRLAAVISNLAANAVKHGTEHQPITLELDGTERAVVRLRVTNAGGIPADALPALFEPFKRTAPAKSGERGLGLGLFIARSIVQAHGGEIAVRSAGETTTLEVTLPREGTVLPGAPSVGGKARTMHERGHALGPRTDDLFPPDEALRRSEARWNAELRRAKQDLRDREDLLRAVLESTPDLVFAKDREGRMLAANSATLRALGRTAEEVLGRSDLEFVDDRAQAEKIIANDARVMERRVTETVEEIFTTREGEAPRTFRSSKSPLRDAEGRITGIVGVSRDITAQRESEQALRDNEERLRLLVEHAPVALAMFDREMRYLTASRRWLTDYDLEGRDLRGLSHYEVFPGGVPEAWKEVHRRALGGKVLRSEEEAFTHVDGRVQWLRWEVRPWRDANAQIGGIVIFSENITERKLRESALGEQRRLYQTVTDNATLALFVLDARQECVFMNPAAERLTGFTFAEVRGHPLHDAIHHTHPDGRPYPLEECPIDRALPTLRREDGEDVFVHKDGHFYPVAFTASPLVDRGEPVGTVIEVRDTTPEKEVERHLRQAVAMRDEFVSIASHELRTPLTALSLQLEGLQKLVARVADGGETRTLKSVDVAIRQADRLEALIEALLDVSRITAGRTTFHRSPFDLRNLVSDTLDRLSALSARAGCEVRMHLGDEATGTWDRGRLEEVLTNLIGNAVKYGPGKPIDVTVVADVDEVSVSVKDHGIGISPEAHARIFGRFERAASTNYGGLGLGLYLARQIVEAHGGRVEVQSVPGEGATFTVRLPRGAPPPEVPPASADRGEVRS